MNTDHIKTFSELLPTLVRFFSSSVVFSNLVLFSSLIAFSNTTQAHPNFESGYDNQHYQQSDQYQPSEHSKQYTPSPFMAYPEILHTWEFADNHKNHHKRDRKRFEELSPAQKERIKKRREAFKALPPEEKQRIYQAREKFYNMPPEKRQRLKEKWRNMTPEEREQSHRRRHKPHKD